MQHENATSVTIIADERLLSLNEVAARTSLSIHTVRKWVQTGRLRTNKLGARRLVPASELARLIAETSVPARAQAA